MVSDYCTKCWSAVHGPAKNCPNCGDDLEARAKCPDYRDALLAAVTAGEPERCLRAAWILGERHEGRAVDALCNVVHESADPFVIEAALEALGKIGAKDSANTFYWASNHPSPIVRAAAGRARLRFSLIKPPPST